MKIFKLFALFLFLSLPVLANAQVNLKIDSTSGILTTSSGTDITMNVGGSTDTIKLKVNETTVGQFAAGGMVTPYSSIAAAGSSQSDGTAIVKALQAVTAANGTKGVVLPASPTAGQTYIIINTANANLKIYPGSGDAISALGANNAMTIAAYTVGYCHAVSASQWWCSEGVVAG